MDITEDEAALLFDTILKKLNAMAARDVVEVSMTTFLDGDSAFCGQVS
jgi:hypothetical protein